MSAPCVRSFYLAGFKPGDAMLILHIKQIAFLYITPIDWQFE